jgi:hypothetical protein
MNKSNVEKTYRRYMKSFRKSMAKLIECEKPEFDFGDEKVYQLIWVLNSRLNELDKIE